MSVQLSGHVETVEAADSGRTFKTTKPVPCGTKLVVEVPLASSSSWRPGSDIPDEAWFDVVAQLARIQKEQPLHLNLRSTEKAQHECPTQSIFEDITDEEFQRAHAQVSANCFLGTVSDGQEKLLLFLYTSFLNHSCVPNAALLTRSSPSGPVHEVYAIEDMRQGEEVVICFEGDELLYMPVDQRRRFLKDHHGLECNCQRCLHAPPSDAVMLQCETMEGGEQPLEGMEEAYLKCEASAQQWHNDPKAVRLSKLIEQLRGFLSFWPLAKGHWRAHRVRGWLCDALSAFLTQDKEGEEWSTAVAEIENELWECIWSESQVLPLMHPKRMKRLQQYLHWAAVMEEDSGEWPHKADAQSGMALLQSVYGAT
eukprot:EG_transcript_11461